MRENFDWEQLKKYLAVGHQPQEQMKKKLSDLSLVNLLKSLNPPPPEAQKEKIEAEIADRLEASWRIDLSEQGLTSEDLRNLFGAVLDNTRQGFFVLQRNNIGVEGAGLIAEFVSKMGKTTVLGFDLRHNNLGDEGLLILKDLIKPDRGLLSLDVRNNGTSLKGLLFTFGWDLIERSKKIETEIPLPRSQKVVLYSFDNAGRKDDQDMGSNLRRGSCTRAGRRSQL